MITCLGTTYLAITIRGIKVSSFCPGPKTRTAVGDFAVVASVITFSLIDRLGFSSVRSETLKAPPVFAPTYQCCTAACNSSWPDDCPEMLSAVPGHEYWTETLAKLDDERCKQPGVAGRRARRAAKREAR